MQKLIIAVIFLTAGGLALLAWEPASSPAPWTAHPLDAGAPPSTQAMGRPVALTGGRPGTPADAPAETPLAHKYRYLLADIDPARRARVLELLARRDRLAPRPTADQPLTPVPAPDIERQLEEIDAELQTLLPHAAYASYELFRESDVEQYHFDEYTGGIREYAPLGPVQERAVLEAKLRQKREYEKLVADAGLERPSMSLAEREHAMAMVERGLEEYRQAYLSEVAPLLDQRQYDALSAFEATEFRLELERLQQIINAR